jgi:hypothetical protein
VGEPIVDRHHCVPRRERHRATSARVFIEFHTIVEGHQDHEILNHVVVLELVLNRVCVVWADLLEESLKVVGRRPGLALATACGSQDVPHVRAACFLVVAVVAVSHYRIPLRMLLAPLLAALGALLGVMDGDVGWCLPITAQGHLPIA